ncbi:hypothetical protein MES4922_90009 [Mesorhizobium ventifaucium]|uniref:Uncharacterized protein n=1 Tax=Mesorhizobium ventifaucium TaxID=666020 RepID=A0ABN8KCL8_9HYPH|nr:hypothetical protein MES4922_90009 [Mesorhizobium ventifaucium]
MTPILDSRTAAATARHDGAYRGRRMSWAEFYRERPDLRPANDNRPARREKIEKKII